MTKKYKCRVEYLQSTGTQYIDTGVYPTQLTAVEYRCAVIGSVDNVDSHLFGSRLSASSEAFDLAYMNTQPNGIEKFRFIHGTTTTQETTTSVTASQLANPHTYYMSGTSFKVDGSEKMSFTTASFTGSYSLWLFGVNSAGSLHNQVRAQRVYKCIIWNNNTLVRDFIPVLDNSGRPAMYDQVSGQLFYNQGTGEFTYGRQIIPVEYLESTGTQYIDLGLKGKNGYDFDYKFNSTRIDGTAYGIGGEWENGKSCYLGLIRDTNYFGYHYQNTSSAIQVQQLTANTDYRVQAHLYSGEQYYVINGTKSAIGTITGSFTSTSNMWLFGIYSSTPLYSYIKVYYCKIWDNGTLIRDFIPCIDENLTPFMFDKVNGTVYLNSGTGQFKVGPNVEKTWGGKKLRRKLGLALANLKKPRKYYCEVEYLESTGTQYIDTGLDYFADFEIGIQLRTSVSNKALGNGAFYCMQRYNQANPYWYFSTGTGTSNSYITSTPITEHHIMKWKDNKIYADGVLLTDFTKSSNTPNRMYLYSADGNNKYPNMIYFCKLWDPDNGELVRDFIPVLDWNMKPCLFDKVTEQLFYNQGTGSFTYGREIHYVEYLESTGTQYIDTGVKLTNNYSVELDYQLTNASQSRAGLFGALNMTGSNQGRFGSILSPSNSYMEHGYGSGNDYWQQGMPDTNRHKLYQKKNEVYFDGTLIHTFSSATFSLAINAYLGNFVYTNYTPAKAKYYGSRWWADNELVRDYKPAIDENGVCFWFDRVSHTIYDNAGTDVFLYPARETEYIEVTDLGTTNQSPCIDLGLKYKSSMSIEVKYTRTEMGVSGSVLPLSNTTTQPLIYMPALNASSKTDRFVWRRSGLPESSYYYDFADYPMTVEFKVDAVNDALTVNDNVVKTGMIAAMNGYTSPYESNSNLYMLSINGTYGGMGKVYYVKLYDTTQVYRDLIPVWKDGVACMYDKQNNVYYSNTKTGTVICGKIIEPEYE